MISVERTHELRRDQDWLPSGARLGGRLVTAAMWTGATLGIVGSALLIPVPELWSFPMGGLGFGAAVASERARRALLRRYMARLTRGAVHLAEVDRRAEGELMVVRGTIEAAASLTGTLSDTRGVYRRMTLTAMGKVSQQVARARTKPAGPVASADEDARGADPGKPPTPLKSASSRRRRIRGCRCPTPEASSPP